ncbi:MAG: hypothetical protein FJZ61_05920 [Chlamydiae bacterium]|nr:hypothetical protein [Chlamydiota bacterium]
MEPVNSIFRPSIEGLERMLTKSAYDPFLFIGLQELFFQKACEELSKSNGQGQKKEILVALKKMENARNLILERIVATPDKLLVANKENLDILQNQMARCIDKYEGMMRLLKPKKARARVRTHV